MPAVNPSAIHMLFSYRLLLSYHFDEFDKALDHSNLLRQHLDGMISTAYIPLFHFYDALSRLAVYENVNQKKQKQFLKTVARHLKN